MKDSSTLIDRVRTALAKEPGLEEKRMFGSHGFMVRGKLCIGARVDRLMCRIDPDLQADLIKNEGCRAVVMRGRKMKGYVYVDAAALTSTAQLRHWVQRVLEQNRRLTS